MFKSKEQKFKEIIHLYSNDITRISYSYLKDKELAKDVTQNTFLKAYENFNSIQNKDSIKYWLIRTAVNECKDHLKSSYNKRTTLTDEEPLISVGLNIDEKFIKQLERKKIRNMLFSIDEKYREILILYYFQELSLKEISSLLNINENTARTRISRARKLFKEVFDKSGGI
ncbi:sigma-70 family RNA polymerase sigma factor [Cytobacillus firmus]|uniref:sigma-70 family RNA polymerase sigma factor n=1 Tax=Cytobacillus firmus TaxID=1399 RepID=UPI00384F9EB8